MKLLLIISVLLVLSFTVLAAEEENQIEEKDNNDSEKIVGMPKPSGVLDYFRPPPCPQSYLFSCQPIMKPVPCRQDEYQVNPYNQRPTRHYFGGYRRAPRCAMPQMMTVNPIIRPIY